MYHTCMVQGKSRTAWLGARAHRYLAVAEELQRRIASGELKAGDRIAGENHLAQTFKVSRVTIRAALAMLEEKGLVVRRAGAGTFVALPRLHQDLTVLENLFAQLTKEGLQSATRVLEYEWSKVDRAALKSFHHPHAMKLSRSWFVGRLPFALTKSYLHPAVRMISRADIARRPGFEILQSLGYRVARADLNVRAEKADKSVAAALRLPKGDPVLVLQRTSFSGRDEPLERTICYLRSDVMEFALSVRGSESVSATFKRFGGERRESPRAARLEGAIG
jgi:GntR family transcriptional regulator